MQKKLATILVPIHLEEPSELEKVSLAQTLAVLHRYPITFMTPVGLDTTWYENFCRGKATIRFERFVWKGRDEYCALLTSGKFYQRFLDYEYMLICHLDSFVFRDELEKWCALGYDYIGSVIYNDIWKTKNPLRKALGLDFPDYMGNGGFALKKISTFYRVSSRFKVYIGLYTWVWRVRKVAFLDDIFVGLYFPKLAPGFRVPPKALAQQFGAAYGKNWKQEDLPFTNKDDGRLPFGIHDWIRCHPDFWAPVLRQYGYAV